MRLTCCESGPGNGWAGQFKTIQEAVDAALTYVTLTGGVDTFHGEPVLRCADQPMVPLGVA